MIWQEQKSEKDKNSQEQKSLQTQNIQKHKSVLPTGAVRILKVDFDLRWALDLIDVKLLNTSSILCEVPIFKRF